MDVNSVINSGNTMKDYENLGMTQNTTENKEVGSTPKTEENANTNAKNSMDKKELDDAINKLNKELEPDKTHAEYAVHKTYNTIIVKIVDDTTDKVIMEFPSEKILDMIDSMCKRDGLFDKKA